MLDMIGTVAPLETEWTRKLKRAPPDLCVHIHSTPIYTPCMSGQTTLTTTTYKLRTSTYIVRTSIKGCQVTTYFLKLFDPKILKMILLAEIDNYRQSHHKRPNAVH
jgi:hypothetical protein